MKNMGIGDWGLGIGDWGLGTIPNPQSPLFIFIYSLHLLKKININKKLNQKIFIFIKNRNGLKIRPRKFRW